MLNQHILLDLSANRQQLSWQICHNDLMQLHQTFKETTSNAFHEIHLRHYAVMNFNVFLSTWPSMDKVNYKCQNGFIIIQVYTCIKNR